MSLSGCNVSLVDGLLWKQEAAGSNPATPTIFNNRGYFMKFSDLVGKTMVSVDSNGDDEILFIDSNGKKYKLYHYQDCCESVTIDDICGDLSDLIGSPIMVASEETSNDNPEGVVKEYQDSFTWTFYKIDTAKGGVTIRWYGDSNGYYSESVDFCEVK
jgi:hypothetical protein